MRAVATVWLGVVLLGCHERGAAAGRTTGAAESPTREGATGRSPVAPGPSAGEAAESPAREGATGRSPVVPGPSAGEAAAGSSTGATGSPSSQAATTRYLGVFDAYPGATALCGEASGAGALRFTWRSYTTAHRLDRVARFYAARHHVPATRRPFVVRGQRATSLALHLAGTGRYPRCGGRRAPPGATVIVVARAAPRIGGEQGR